MSFQRRSLAGRDEDGTLRGGADHYSARGLRERLKEYTPEMTEALKWSASQWTGFMERYRDERKLPSAERKMAGICSYSQERLIMRAFGMGLELPTTHYPELLDTAPSLLQWCRDALNYVVELEDVFEASEAELASTRVRHDAVEKIRLDQAVQLEAGARERLAQAELFGRLQVSLEETEQQLEETSRDLATSEDMFDGVQAQYEAAEAARTKAELEVRDLRRDLAAASEVCASWKLSAHTSSAMVLALRRAGVIDLEVVPDGPQLPAVRLDG